MYKSIQASSESNKCIIIILLLNEVEKGVYWNDIIRLSICPSVDTTP